MAEKRHGFLAFNDIQSDYYQIPSEDKEKIKEAEETIRENLKNENINASQENNQQEMVVSSSDMSNKMKSKIIILLKIITIIKKILEKK